MIVPVVLMYQLSRECSKSIFSLGYCSQQFHASLACQAPSSKEGSGQTHRAVLFKWVQEFLGPIIARKVWISLNSIIIYSKSRNEDSKNKTAASYCPCVSYLRPKLDNTRAHTELLRLSFFSNHVFWSLFIVHHLTKQTLLTVQNKTARWVWPDPSFEEGAGQARLVPRSLRWDFPWLRMGFSLVLLHRKWA